VRRTGRAARGEVRIEVRSLRPRRTWARPGEPVAVEATLVASRPVHVELTLDLLDVARVVASSQARARIGPRPTSRTLRLRLPDLSRHGYGLRLRARSASGASASATGAIEALEGWWQAPRHAALTDLRVAARTAAIVSGLRDWHVTVAQHYDWMWRHHRYEPPDGRDPFVDTLGRTVSHAAVRAGIRAGRAAGIASLAYGSVYGAEAEHVARHPDDRVFDAAGEPISLGGTFFITDVRPGSPWRQRLLRQYERAVRRFGFDGIHMDTYGQPHRAIGHDGGEVDFAALYPGLIEEAAERLDRSGARVMTGAGAPAAGATAEGRTNATPARERPSPRVLFNCVDGFPLERVAGAPTAALYLEVWPPDDRLADVLRWVDEARRTGGGRAVVIAAYALALARDGAATGRAARAAAFEATLLLTSVISAAGAFHHTLADGDRLIVEGYYPAAVPLRRPEARELMAAWRFGARYLHLLSDPGPLEPGAPGDGASASSPNGVELLDASGRPVPVSAVPEAGRAWVRRLRTPSGIDVLSIVDLTGQRDDRWTGPLEPSPRRSGWLVRWPGATGLVGASPWTADGDAGPLQRAAARESRHDQRDQWRLAPFRRWTMVVSDRRIGPSGATLGPPADARSGARTVVDSAQAWFWAEAWQAGEREASADIAAGRTRRLESDEDFLDSLD
jgi:dextranase